MRLKLCSFVLNKRKGGLVNNMEKKIKYMKTMIVISFILVLVGIRKLPVLFRKLCGVKY
jgi:hypothetical protein